MGLMMLAHVGSIQRFFASSPERTPQTPEPSG
jgi:hypothetical protein